eukprot:13717195-Alexandrium_andersonii.AAC.1
MLQAQVDSASNPQCRFNPQRAQSAYALSPHAHPPNARNLEALRLTLRGGVTPRGKSAVEAL